MTLFRWLFFTLIFLPPVASAHNFIIGQQVAAIIISDRGELLLNNSVITYQTWKSTDLRGKVHVVQYIAGRTSAKKKNALLIRAIKNANFPGDRFLPTTIVNTDDEIPGVGYFVRKKIETNKKRYPWAQFIIDSKGLGRQAWRLKEGSSTILVLDKEGRVQWAKDGALTEEEVHQVLTQVVNLLNS